MPIRRYVLLLLLLPCLLLSLPCFTEAAADRRLSTKASVLDAAKHDGIGTVALEDASGLPRLHIANRADDALASSADAAMEPDHPPPHPHPPPPATFPETRERYLHRRDLNHGQITTPPELGSKMPPSAQVPEAELTGGTVTSQRRATVGLFPIPTPSHLPTEGR